MSHDEHGKRSTSLEGGSGMSTLNCTDFLRKVIDSMNVIFEFLVPDLQIYLCTSFHIPIIFLHLYTGSGYLLWSFASTPWRS
mgnify:CR=1 FL=1